VLTTFVFAGAQQPPPEEAAGTTGGPREILKAGSGYKNVINTDLVDDPMLTAENIKTFKELYDFSMVRPENCSACTYWRAVLTQPRLCAECDHSLPEEIGEAERGCEWPPRAGCPGQAHLR
jgi:hypothetical protein